MRLGGLVFDMDGTLIDNLKYHFLAFDEYAKQMGFTLLEPLSLKHNGLHSNDIFPMLLGEDIVAEYGLDRLNNEKEEVYRELYSPHIKPITGLMELLQAAKESDIKCAIGSSGCRENVEFVIEALGIKDFIDVSISGSDVTHGKPHPEIFATAIERMGLKPEECIVVEDAVNGILAGIAAGCKCLAVTTTSSAELLSKTGAALCIDDFTEVDIEKLQQLINS